MADQLEAQDHTGELEVQRRHAHAVATPAGVGPGLAYRVGIT